MDRNVERRESLLDDPSHLGFVNVRQCQVIPEQERQPIILIFYMERSPDFLGILVHETKHTLVLARHGLDWLEFQAERFPLPPHERDLLVLCLNRCSAAYVCCIELKIDRV